MGRKLVMTSRHYKILKAIKELQPCSCPEVARAAGLNEHFVESVITQSFYRLGWVDSEIVKWKKTQRKPGTIRLTEEGEIKAKEANMSFEEFCVWHFLGSEERAEFRIWLGSRALGEKLESEWWKLFNDWLKASHQKVKV